MEYTKDMILHVNYGQVGNVQKNTRHLWNRIGQAIVKHKMITTIVSITAMLMILDFILVASFVQVLSSI